MKLFFYNFDGVDYFRNLPRVMKVKFHLTVKMSCKKKP